MSETTYKIKKGIKWTTKTENTCGPHGQSWEIKYRCCPHNIPHPSDVPDYISDNPKICPLCIEAKITTYKDEVSYYRTPKQIKEDKKIRR
jgi:hypothetical protein